MDNVDRYRLYRSVSASIGLCHPSTCAAHFADKVSQNSNPAPEKLWYCIARAHRLMLCRFVRPGTRGVTWMHTDPRMSGAWQSQCCLSSAPTPSRLTRAACWSVTDTCSAGLHSQIAACTWIFGTRGSSAPAHLLVMAGGATSRCA